MEPMDADLMIIAIDGPAGAGKSTVAKALAAALDVEYLDTGAMYRAVTWAVLDRGVPLDDPVAVASIATQIHIDLAPDGSVVVDGIDVTTAIRNPEVSAKVSEVAAVPEVRTEMVGQQREWARKRGGGVLDGRDIGTAVFPNARLKVYLTASASARAARRALEKNTEDRKAVQADMARRDAYDSTRSHDPLRQASDAYLVDTSAMTVDEVIAVIVAELDGSADDV